MLCKECLCRLPALCGGLHRLTLLCLTGCDLLFADADIAAHLLHGLAGSLPCSFPGFFLAVELLQHGVLAAVRQLLLLRGVVGTGGIQRGPAGPEFGQLFQRMAPQDVLVLVVGRFQGLFGLGGFAAAVAWAASCASSASARSLRASRPI